MSSDVRFFFIGRSLVILIFLVDLKLSFLFFEKMIVWFEVSTCYVFQRQNIFIILTDLMQS